MLANSFGNKMEFFDGCSYGNITIDSNVIEHFGENLQYYLETLAGEIKTLRKENQQLRGMVNELYYPYST